MWDQFLNKTLLLGDFLTSSHATLQFGRLFDAHPAEKQLAAKRVVVLTNYEAGK